jgi:hypothetical protein
MLVCCVCCVLSGRSLCDELITLPEESYRLWRVVVCDQEIFVIRGGHSPRWAAEPEKIIIIIIMWKYGFAKYSDNLCAPCRLNSYCRMQYQCACCTFIPCSVVSVDYQGCL